MANVNLNNPIEIRMTGMKVLTETLGPIGVAKFMQQYNIGYGDYTKEKQEELDISFDEIDRMLKQSC